MPEKLKKSLPNYIGTPCKKYKKKYLASKIRHIKEFSDSINTEPLWQRPH